MRKHVERHSGKKAGTGKNPKPTRPEQKRPEEWQKVREKGNGKNSTGMNGKKYKEE